MRNAHGCGRVEGRDSNSYNWETVSKKRHRSASYRRHRGPRRQTGNMGINRMRKICVINAKISTYLARNREIELTDCHLLILYTRFASAYVHDAVQID